MTQEKSKISKRENISSGTSNAPSTSNTTSSATNASSGNNLAHKKDKNFQTKVVIRRLPPSMTEELFLEQVSPIPDNDYFYFVKADLSLGVNAFARAYVNFLNQDDVFIFKDKFDGYVFLDAKGAEYPGIVEFSPFQKIPKKRPKKRDVKCNTIEQDPDYTKFLESLNAVEPSLPSAESYLEELEAKEKASKAEGKAPTPLIEYLRAKKIEKQKIRDEKREERKRRELERKRIREEERKKRKAEKDKFKTKESGKDKGTDETGNDDESSEQPVVKVLKNPEREKERQKEEQQQKEKKHEEDESKSSRSDSLKSDTDESRKVSHKVDHKPIREEKRRPYSDDRSRFERPRRDSYHNPKSSSSSYHHRHREDKVVEKFDKKDKTTEKVDKNEEIEKEVKKDKNDPEETAEDTKEASEEVKDDGEADKKSVTKDDKSSDGNGDSSKDPRTERRIRNKDRPAMEIYKPGMRRMGNSQPNSSSSKDVASSNSSSPSPTPTVQAAKAKEKPVPVVDTRPPPKGKSYYEQRRGRTEK